MIDGSQITWVVFAQQRSDFRRHGLRFLTRFNARRDTNIPRDINAIRARNRHHARQKNLQANSKRRQKMWRLMCELVQHKCADSPLLQKAHGNFLPQARPR